MFAGVFTFELRYQLRNPVFWVAVVIFFLLAFGAATVDQIQIGSGGNVHKNAPFAIAQMMLILSLFYMFVSTAFVANVIVRDDDSGFGPIVRATRITRTAYVFGRYTGAFVAAALGFLAIPLAVWIGSHMPWIDPEQVGPNSLSYYALPYLWLALPDLFLTSALFFALATTTRSMMATYIGVVAFLIVWTIATVVLDRNPAYELVGAYGEPLGFGAASYMTKYWTAADRNTMALPLQGMLLWNRVLAIGIGGAALVFAFATFRFADKPTRQSRRAQQLAARAAAEEMPATVARLPDPRFDRATAFAQLGARTRLEMVQVFRSPAFFVLMALGLFNAMAALIDLGEVFGTPVLPVTRVVIRLLEGSFGFIPIIIAIYYAGELVWRERDRKTHEIIDASAIPDWAFVIPKALAVMLVLFATLLISVAGGVVMQLIHGYSDIEFSKYLLWYVLPTTVDFTLLAILSVFVQALSPHKFVGWGIMVLYVITRITFANLGYADVLYNYARVPAEPLSDMNGAGAFWIGAWWVRLYWTAFAVFLLVLAHVLWRRGTETRLRPRIARMPRRLAGVPGVIALAALIVFAGTGVWIYTNTHVWNEYRTTVSDDDWLADYERTLLPYEKTPQPAVQSVRLAIDLRPHQPRMTATGTMTLVNLQAQPIRNLHIRLGDRLTRLVSLDVPGATVLRDYPKFQYRIYRLPAPLAPGATTTIAFRSERGQRGFPNGRGDTRLVDNGTFLDNSEFAPIIGMSRANLLQDRVKRRKHGLPGELRPPKLEDLAGTRRNGYGMDWVRTDITVSTDADQTPIAPGYKLADTTAAGRRTARFVVDAPILNFYSVQSARYAERHRRHDGIDLAVYYDAPHGANVDRMLAAFAHGLDYFQPAFGPYQFRQARVIEFPDYAQFAQAFAGTMPYSEGIGFIADLSDRDKIDYVTYVTAHELAHQWWAHQAVGSDNQGSTMLTETLAQYSALMVMEKLYGRDQIRRFLKYELDRYLKSRGGEVIEELPLDRVEDQPYIHYRKGSLVMYRLKDELGADRVNAALKRYVTRYKFKGAPYPRSLDLIAEFRRGATPAENALISDLFDRITLYDIKTTSAVTRRLPDGNWETALTVDAHKLYADGRGKEREAPMAEQAEFGAFTAMPGRGKFAATNVLTIKRLPIRTGVQTIRLVTRAKPSFAGADPYNTHIDRNADDNVITTGG
ncbi:aminopeptidase [Sphingomonas sp. Leaf339]|uniref:ABC transporter permease/M1 family aminopeptidase n=1 Tax=Sphingomonas sp. Leaf339 TaxID=1736343 RepID=UPI0006F4FD4A|nr:M1 family aminopeptidase [Sphingomonas sp. Leaf339]KQU55798.1 aminopeptidase [Sphingomonas sp. Leaf339]